MPDRSDHSSDRPWPLAWLAIVDAFASRSGGLPATVWRVTRLTTSLIVAVMSDKFDNFTHNARKVAGSPPDESDKEQRLEADE